MRIVHNAIVLMTIWQGASIIFTNFQFAIYETTFFVYNKSGNKNRREEIRMKAQWKLMLNNPTEVSGTYCSFFSIPSICFDKKISVVSR